MLITLNDDCYCNVYEGMCSDREGDLKAMDAEQLRECGHKMVDFIADYYKNIESFPVLSQVEVFYLFPVFSTDIFGFLSAIVKSLSFIENQV